MENTVGDVQHCEEQLKTTLQCDDKEKLREKLLLLQREYLRTAQRLQRAERSEAVRRHVRSRITQQQVQSQPEVTSNRGVNVSGTPTLTAADGKVSGLLQCQGHTGGPADSKTSRSSQVVRFLLPSDAASPQTTNPIHDSPRGHRASPALRSRSRLSRLCWERRSAEAGRSTNSSEEGQGQRERMETSGRCEEEGQPDVLNASKEMLSGTESVSPPLLFTHWNAGGQNEKRDMKGQDIQGGQEQREKQTGLMDEGKKESVSASMLLTCCNTAIDVGGRGHEGLQAGSRKEGEGDEGTRGQRDGRLCEDSSSAEQKEKQTECEKKDDTSEKLERDAKGVSLLDSCTLVEGLLFPAEYYVRTTRRMTSSQSQPDMQAVILSQLNMGRHRRSRGRGRSLNKNAHRQEVSDSDSRSDVSSPLAESASLGPRSNSQDASSELNGQTSSVASIQISAQLSRDACASPAVSTPNSARGRKRRGRGRGGPQTPQCSFRLKTHQLGLDQTSEDPQPRSSSVPSSPSLRGDDALKPCVTQGEAGPVPDDSPPASTLSADAQPPPGGGGAQSSSASGCGVYPIFLKNRGTTDRSAQMSGSPVNWRSLLLPSSSPAQTSPLPPPSLSLGPLIKNLTQFDFHQDFHLPDEQFASLKLHKLRQVAVETGVEHLTSPSFNTRSSLRRRESCHDGRNPEVPLSLVPTAADSPTSAQSADVQDMLMDHKLTGTWTSQSETLPSAQRCAGGAACEDTHPYSQSSLLTNSTHRSDRPVTPQPHVDSADGPTGKEGDVISQMDDTEVLSTDSPGVVSSLTLGSTTHQKEDEAVSSPFDCSQQRSPEEPYNSCTAATPKSSRKKQDRCSPHRGVRSQLLLSPPLTSAAVLTPHLRSSLPPSSPALPSLGVTPRPVPAACPLSPSPSAPVLMLPPPHSPSTQALSPPSLSPRPSLTPTSLTGQLQAPHEPSQRAEPAASPTVSGGQVAPETAGGHMMRRTHTLKSPAGGRLVDACCLPGPSGGLCVAAAGQWAVCLWSQTAASAWRLLHTWSFTEPVIGVFPVPDAAGLVCVTLGQLEIKEVRILSCSSLLQMLLCEGLVQAAVGVSESRVATSSHSASGSTLQVFTLSDSGSTLTSQDLAAPGVCVRALATVDGLTDALLGIDESGRLFVWNLKTGQLLQRILLGDGLSHTACLRGYSHGGVLFVLLQHQLFSSVEVEDQEEEEEARKKMALLSLVAVNPLSGKSALATQLCPPKAWSGRLCDADVHGGSVVGLSQSGCTCVWELGRRGSAQMVWAPEREGWQLARWGGDGTLVTGHHDGNVTLHHGLSRATLSR